MILRADKILLEMSKTFRHKNKVYGDNWIVFGQIMAALFPKGLKLKTEYEFARAHFFMLILGKFTRYVNKNMECKDSAHDAAIYFAMLEDFLNLEGLGNGRYVRRDNWRERKPRQSNNRSFDEGRLQRGNRLVKRNRSGRNKTVQRRKGKGQN